MKRKIMDRSKFSRLGREPINSSRTSIETLSPNWKPAKREKQNPAKHIRNRGPNLRT